MLIVNIGTFLFYVLQEVMELQVKNAIDVR
jgi:hypothetical protein